MYHTVQRDNASIIEVTNELDIASAPALSSAIEMAAQSADRPIIVSLEQCTFCDSTGLGALATAKKRLGAQFILVLPPSNRVTRIFDVTGLTTYLTPCASLQEALDSTNAIRPSIPPTAA